MTIKTQPDLTPMIESQPISFDTVEQAWFWFMEAQKPAQTILGSVRINGAYQGKNGAFCRDVFRLVDRLYRNRRLKIDHLLVLRHYGRRQSAPKAQRVKEARAATLWREAMRLMEPAFVSAGIVSSMPGPHGGWVEEAIIYERSV